MDAHSESQLHNEDEVSGPLCAAGGTRVESGGVRAEGMGTHASQDSEMTLDLSRIAYH